MQRPTVKNLQRNRPLKRGFLKTLREFLAEVLAEEQRSFPRSIWVLIVDDLYIQSLNLQFLGKDRPTDVLAFPLGNRWEIYVSADTAWKEAQERGISLEEELARYALHGLLHLMGYDHKGYEENQPMFRIQEAYMRRWKMSR